MNSKKLYQKYKDKIVDIVLFGSSVKNKLSPNDIDIAILLKNTKEAELLNLMKEFGRCYEKEVHLNLIISETIISNPLYKTILKEGISALNNKPLHEKLGFDSGAIFSFTLTSLEKSKKVLFYYALHGKKKQRGVLNQLNGRMLSNTVIFVPVKYVDEFQSFLEQWKLDFHRMDVLRG